MYAEDGYPTFTKNLSKFIHAHWSKVRRDPTKPIKPGKNVDDVLQREYENLLKEIDILTADKSCHLSFKNANFNKVKSSDDLVKILSKHSSEVLKNYIKQHDPAVKHDASVTRGEILNYITEIILSMNKCNNKLCTCKPVTASKEIITDNNASEGQEVQTGSSSDYYIEKGTNAAPNKSQKSNQTNTDNGRKSSRNANNLVNVAVQTDENVDPKCTCGCCPKNSMDQQSEQVLTDLRDMQDASTSDRMVIGRKKAIPNCMGETIDRVSSSNNKLCVPHNFETLIKHNRSALGFSACTEGKRDCACDAYDVKQALKRGLVLPSSDICIQKKSVKISSRFSHSKKFKMKQKNKKIPISSSEEFEGSSDITLSSLGKHKESKKFKESEKKREKEDKAREKKNKEKEKKHQKKEKKSKKRRDSSKSSDSSFTPRSEAKKEKENSMGCFSRKKKTRCDETCKGIQHKKSMQTMQVITSDKTYQADLYEDPERRAVETSTNWEAGTYISEEFEHEDKEILHKPEKDQGKESSSKKFKKRLGKRRAENKHRDSGSEDYKEGRAPERSDNKHRTDRDRYAGGTVCQKCGREKRHCVAGCRNTIVIPYGTGSSRTLAGGEVESLRMLIKMQTKDTNRQFDNVMTELNYQKSEIRRLNDMHHKLAGDIYDIQKVTSTSKSRRSSDTSRDVNSKKSSNLKECGCSSNECKLVNKYDSPRRSNNINDSNNSNNSQLRRFGPPNTAVAINMCDTCNVEIGRDGGLTASYSPTSHYEGDKQKKNFVNQSRKNDESNRNISSSSRNATVTKHTSKGEAGDNAPSVSTIYKNRSKAVDKNERNEGTTDELEYDVQQEAEIEKEDDKTTGMKEPRKSVSSKIIVWIKQSWVSVRHKADECKKKQQERKESRRGLRSPIDFCQSQCKKAATGMWKSIRKARRAL